MPHLDTTFRINDVLAICGALFVVGRLIAGYLGKVFREYHKRLELHELALERAGWLVRDFQGHLIVAAHRQNSQAGV